MTDKSPSDCGDSSCICIAPHERTGMRTNGGCRCDEGALRRAVLYWKQKALNPLELDFNVGRHAYFIKDDMVKLGKISAVRITENKTLCKFDFAVGDDYESWFEIDIKKLYKNKKDAEIALGQMID